MFERKVFLFPIIDLFNGEIISYTVSDHPREESKLIQTVNQINCTTSNQN